MRFKCFPKIELWHTLTGFWPTVRRAVIVCFYLFYFVSLFWSVRLFVLFRSILRTNMWQYCDNYVHQFAFCFVFSCPYAEPFHPYSPKVPTLFTFFFNLLDIDFCEYHQRLYFTLGLQRGSANSLSYYLWL